MVTHCCPLFFLFCLTVFCDRGLPLLFRLVLNLQFSWLCSLSSLGYRPASLHPPYHALLPKLSNKCFWLHTMWESLVSLLVLSVLCLCDLPLKSTCIVVFRMIHRKLTKLSCLQVQAAIEQFWWNANSLWAL